jgi:hypothetical protein
MGSGVPKNDDWSAKASSQVLTKAREKAMVRLLPTPAAATATYRARINSSETAATYAMAARPRNVNITDSSSEIAVSTSMPRAAQAAPMAIFPLNPMWRMGSIIPEGAATSPRSRA